VLLDHVTRRNESTGRGNRCVVSLKLIDDAFGLRIDDPYFKPASGDQSAITIRPRFAILTLRGSQNRGTGDNAADRRPGSQILKSSNP
jgi:hypothetical protein